MCNLKSSLFLLESARTIAGISITITEKLEITSVGGLYSVKLRIIAKDPTKNIAFRMSFLPA